MGARRFFTTAAKTRDQFSSSAEVQHAGAEVAREEPKSRVADTAPSDHLQPTAAAMDSSMATAGDHTCDSVTLAAMGVTRDGD